MKSKVIMIFILLVATVFFVVGYFRYQGNLRETLAKEIGDPGFSSPNEPSEEQPGIEDPSTEGPVLIENPELVKMPDLFEMTKEEAEEVLKDMKLQMEVLEEKNSSFATGTVFFQKPYLDEEILQGKTVTVYVSNQSLPEEEEKIAVPMLIGLTEEEAVEELRTLGFQVDYEYNPNSDYREGMVYSQNYLVDSRVSKGTKITIRVSTGS
jgi:beta-lactam-binding protein with PASTA domain